MAELLIAAPYDASYAGILYIVSGSSTGEVWLPDEPTQIASDIPQLHLGTGLALSGDNDGDGLADMLVGGPAWDGWSSKVAWFAGPVSGHRVVSDADVLLTDTPGGLTGESVDGGGDVDGDGRDDLLLTSLTDCMGSVHVFTAVPQASLSEAIGRLDGTEDCASELSYGDFLGNSLSMLDANGDGLDDILAGAPGSGLGGSELIHNSYTAFSGAAALFLAPFSGSRTMWEADSLWVGEGHSDHLGWSVSTAGDMDQDGIEDLLIGAAYFDDPDDDVTSTVGAAYVILGQPTW